MNGSVAARTRHRLVRGRDGWWCIAPAGVALVPDKLVRDGKLTESAMAEVDRLGILTPRAPAYYSLTVLTSTAGDLGCPYCLRHTGTTALPDRFDPPRSRHTMLSSDVVDAAVEFTRQRMAQMGFSRLHVLLFGGEPLLNPYGCQRVLTRCGELGEVTGHMISNGVLLSRRRAVELYAAGLRSVQIAVDGPAGIHDSARPTRDGRPTLDQILANVATAQEATDLRFNFRVNVRVNGRINGRGNGRVHGAPSTLAGLLDLVDKMAAPVAAERCGFTIVPDGPFPLDSRAVLTAYALARERGFRIPRPHIPYCAFCFDEHGRYGAVVNADGTLFSSWDSVGGFADATGAARQAADDLDELDAGLLDLIRNDAPMGDLAKAS